MALSTFGAIMGFAAETVRQTESAYKTLVQKVKDPVLRETLQTFLGEAGKTHSLMEKTRRENVTEMILEPVAGLQREDYQIDQKMLDATEDVDLLKAAMMLESRDRKYFLEVSSKVPLPEVARIFRKIAQKKEGNLEKLRSLGLTGLKLKV